MPKMLGKLKNWLEGESELLAVFPTYARRDSATNDVRMRIRAWVFEPELHSWMNRKIVAKLQERLEIEPGTFESQLFEERVRPFLVDNERWQRVTIEAASRTFDLGRSAPDGHVFGQIRLTGDEALRASGGTGLLPFRCSIDTASVDCVAPIVEGPGLSVISDIDDTVKITGVLDKNEMLRNTFIRPFQPVQELADIFGDLRSRGASFHYVSAGPWQLLPFLETFLDKHSFPHGSFHMRQLRVKSIRSPFSFIKTSQDHKDRSITRIVQELGRRQFILVGDSGEKDPEIYGDVARRFPGRIERILIRQVPGAENTPERFGAAFAELDPELWDVRELM